MFTILFFTFNFENQEVLAKSIESAVDSYGKLTDEVKQSIELIRAYVEEDESKSSASQESKDEKQIENTLINN